LTESQNKKIRLLVVSREAAILGLLRSLAESNAWHLETAASGWDAMERVQPGAVPQLLVLDISRGDADSLHFLRWLRRLKGDLAVVLLCYPGEAAQAKDAVRVGAGEILVRPFDSKQLEVAIRRQLAPAGKGEAEMPGRSIEALGHDTFFVSTSLIMQKLRAQAALLAKTDVPVLIVGERGVGKYSVASLIHSLSVRSGFKLRRVNCAETPESLLETELFGNEPAATAGASRGSLGKFGAGEKGTVFLDEITALPATLQSRLLQVLQNEELGASADGDATPANVRFLAASSVHLERAVAEKRLREDLYYRLSSFTVHVPPLRQRKDEIAVLLRYFMHKLAKYYSLPARGFSSPALDACQRYSWPGNLKEMETFVKRYLVAGDEELSLHEMGVQVPVRVRWAEPPAETRVTEPGVTGQKELKPESLKSLIQGIKSEAEQNAIGAALRRTGWNRKAAARLLRVSYRTLLYKIDQYHMRAPEPYLSPLPVEQFSEYEEVKGNGKAS
jgi:two-component system response regulator AtoC